MGLLKKHSWLLAFVVFIVSCSKKSDDTTPVTPPVVTVPDNDPLLLGNPTNASTSTAASTNYLKSSGYYSISYNDARGTSNWVAWHLQSEDLGSTPRQDDFRADNALPSTFYKVSPASYSGSGFDKGHNCPSADRTSTVVANSSTFLMTNMIPQAPNFNQGPWAGLESFIRNTLVSTNKEAWLYMGNFGTGGYNGTNTLVDYIDGGHVIVPATVWKIVVVISKGNNDLARVDTSATVLAVEMPNDNRLYTTGGTTLWRNYVTNISNIEAHAVSAGASTMDILSKVPGSVKSYLKSKVYQ
jgi:endonuclease G